MGVFYPPNWIFALSNVELALRVWWVFHLSVGAVSFYFLARHWKLDVVPSLCAGISFAFSTYIIISLEGGHTTTCLVWGPLVLLLSSLVITRTSACAANGISMLVHENAVVVLALGIAMALQIVSSGEFFYYTIMLAGAYVAQQLVALDWKLRGWTLAQLATAGVLALALALPFLTLVLELVPYTARAGEMNALAGSDSAHPRYWLTFLVPYLYGRPGYPDAFWAPTINEMTLGHCYVGVLPLLSMPLGIAYFGRQPQFRERRRLIGFWAAVAVAGLLLAMGDYTPAYPLLHAVLPGLGHFRFPTKFLLFVTYAFAMLGALGLQATRECRAVNEVGSQKRVWYWAFGFVCLLTFAFAVALLHEPFLVWLMDHPGQPSPVQIQATKVDFFLAVVFSAIGVVLLWFAAWRTSSARWLQVAFVSIVFVNIWIISRQTQPTVREGIYDPESAAMDKRLKADPMYRGWTPYWASAQYLYGENRPEILAWAKSAGIVTCWNFKGIYRACSIGLAPNAPERLYWALSLEPQPALQERIADLLCIRQRLEGEPFDKIMWGGAARTLTPVERPSALPRAFVATRWRVAGNADSAWDTLMSDGFDPHQEVVIEPLPGEPADRMPLASTQPVSPAMSPVKSLVDEQQQVIIAASAPRQSLLVLEDTWYPGWTVTVDGQASPIYRVNYAFRGVFIEPGEHHIEFSYRPKYFQLGVCACAATAVGSLLLVAVARGFGRKRRATIVPSAPK
jgi:hypothetical protein